MSWRRFTRRVLARCGYKISYAQEGIGGSPFFDLQRLIGHDHPFIFDVGANIGQSIERFRKTFPRAEIHSFEPSPAIYRTLTSNTQSLAGVHRWNCALGARPGQLELLENSKSEWSSFLPLGSGFGTVVGKTMVAVSTVDEFCREHAISHIDILKSDTQGYDMEVFKGAQDMFSKNAVTFIYCEMNFSDLYEGMPSFGQLFDFLTGAGFSLVSLYDIAYEKGLAAWTDGLFVNNLHKPS